MQFKAAQGGGQVVYWKSARQTELQIAIEGYVSFQTSALMTNNNNIGRVFWDQKVITGFWQLIFPLHLLLIH